METAKGEATEVVQRRIVEGALCGGVLNQTLKMLFSFIALMDYSLSLNYSCLVIIIHSLF